MNSFLDLLKREPVRAASVVIVAVVLVVSLVTGTPVAAVIAQVGAVAAIAEKVRSMVTPFLGDSSVTDGTPEA